MRKPHIYYHAYDHDHPTGGQKHTYQHVDVLVRGGYDAYVVHAKAGYRLKWFENDTRVTYLDEVRNKFDPKRDFIVLPEDIGLAIGELPGRKVIFNKNLFSGFTKYGWAMPDRYDPPQPGVIAILTVSQHDKIHLEYAYPNIPVIRVECDLYCERFPFRPLSSKSAVIACSSKAPKHVLSVIHIVRSRSLTNHNSGKAFRWVSLENISEQQVAATLGDAILLIFLSIEEGLSRVPLEAMASGCLVAAYREGPGCEYLPKDYGFECGDILSVAQFVESVMNAYPRDLAK